MALYRTVALLGVTPITLILGRALALRDNPALGIYDPDPQEGLKASLFLGISAFTTTQQLLQSHPDLLVSSLDLESDFSPGTPVLQFDGLSSARPDTCWIEVEQPDRPTEISNALPPLEFKATGPDPTVAEVEAWLRSLSTLFEVRRCRPPR